MWSVWWSAAGLVGALGLLGCESPIDLLVEIESDVAASAVDRVVTTLDGIEVRERAVDPGEDLAAGVRVAEFEAVIAGPHDVRTCLHAGAVVVGCAEREIRLSQSSGVTLEIAADCAALGCPAGTPCVSGRCEALECTSPADCAPPVACASPSCADGACSFQPDDARCTGGGRCDLRAGCLAAPTLAIDAPGGSQVPAGANALLVVRAIPAESWAAGDDVVVRVSDGTLRSSDDEGAELTLVLDAAKMLPVVEFVSTALDPGSEVELSADVPVTGTTRLAIAEPRLVPVTAGSAEYSVRSDHTLDAPLAIDDASQRMLVHVEAMAVAPEGGAFEGVFFTIAERTAPPIIARATIGGALSEFARSDGADGPDERAQTMAFAPPGSAYGDHLFVCSESTTGGDGLFAISGAGEFRRFLLLNNATGLAFDPGMRLGDSPDGGFAYLARQSEELWRVAPDGTYVVLGRLPFFQAGVRTSVPQAGGRAGSVMLASAGDYEVSGDGAIYRIADVEPYSGAELVLDSLPDPAGVVSGADAGFEDVLYVAMETSGELVALTTSNELVPIVRGLSAPAAIALDPEGGAIWIAERGAGRVVRLRRR
jgi:hypothetical protein